MANRLEVLKTYKIYIGGKFPRTESGRSYPLNNSKGEVVANVCLSSRKDVRNAIVAARSAQASWASKTAYNRSQILYRISEMMETRKSELIEQLVLEGYSSKKAENEVYASIDRVIYFAGWCDKVNQIFGSVNPVASKHFNFSMLEPAGVVTSFANDSHGLISMINATMPIIASGNTVVVLAGENHPLSAVTLAEILATSDVPGGVINILTGKEEELLEHMTTHLDVNATYYSGDNKDSIKTIQLNAVDNLKRIILEKSKSADSDEIENPYIISEFMETKTTWHPIETISASGSGY